QVARPAPPPEPSVTTPPISYSVPEDISRAPRKKDTKLTFTPEALTAMRSGSSSTMIEEKMDTPTDQTITETSLAPIMENILAEMQKIHGVFLQKVIRNEQKTEALGIMTRVIDQIKSMSNEIKKTPAQQKRQQPLENINHEQVSLEQVMTELADIKKTIK